MQDYGLEWIAGLTIHVLKMSMLTHHSTTQGI